MLINLNAAALRLGKPRQWLEYYVKKDPPPGYVVKDHNGRTKINDEHVDFKELERKMFEDGTGQGSDIFDDIQDLVVKAKKAGLEKIIAEAGTQKEKEKQAILETNRSKKDLVPFGLLAHFFSYIETINLDLFKRPHEIMPQLAALILSCKDNKYLEAEKFLIKELEVIVKNNTKELLDDIEREGLEYDADS